MFWRKEREAVVASLSAIVAPPQSTPKAIAKTESEEVLEEYAKTATALGFVPGAFTEARFRAYLKKNAIQVYDIREVEAFLDQTFPRSGYSGGWVWVPLRKEDQKKVERHGSGKNGYIRQSQTYQKVVPLAVLQSVERIVKEIPEVHFFVSDAAERPEGDPFLMVACVGMSPYVIECWDEPGFTGRAK